MLTLIRVLVIGFLMYIAFVVGCGGFDTSLWSHGDRTLLGWMLIGEMILTTILTVMKHNEIV